MGPRSSIKSVIYIYCRSELASVSVNTDLGPLEICSLDLEGDSLE